MVCIVDEVGKILAQRYAMTLNMSMITSTHGREVYVRAASVRYG